MAEELELLNSEAHKSLRMRPDLGEYPHFVPIGINEFAAAAAVCPIFLAKDASSGEFYAAALFGFRPGELLVEGAENGRSPFRPLDLQRQGFFVVEENIAVDPTHARFGTGASVALFGEDGQPSDEMRQVQRALGQLKMGIDALRDFIRELLALKLVEPIDINLSFDDGEKLQLDGLYTVSRDTLSDLDDAKVIELFRKGYLQAVYCMTVSLNQVSVLAKRRNERLAAPL